MKTLFKFLLCVFIATALLPAKAQIPNFGQSGYQYSTNSNGPAIGTIIGTTGQIPYAGTKTGNALTSDSNFTRVDSSQATTIRVPATGGGYNGISVSPTDFKLYRGPLTYSLPANATLPTTIKVQLTPSIIEGLNSTPDTLIKAPAGQFIQVQAVTIIYSYGTTRYSNGVTFGAYYNGSSGSYIFTDDGINHNDASAYLVNTTLSQQSLTASVLGQPLLLTASTAQTGGDGVEDIYITYSFISYP